MTWTFQDFRGARPGCVFKRGEHGLGYYPDPLAPQLSTDSTCSSPQVLEQDDAPSQHSAEGEHAAGCEAQRKALVQGHRKPVHAARESTQAAQQDAREEEGACSQAEEHPPHYWGQALQYLEKSADVAPGGLSCPLNDMSVLPHSLGPATAVICAHAGKRVTLLASRDGGQVRFRLREGVGGWVDRAPWRIEWGGGASVENPHVQRVHYCQLLVRWPGGFWLLWVPYHACCPSAEHAQVFWQHAACWAHMRRSATS